MRRVSFADMNCSIAQCLEVVGEWWTVLILRDSFLGVTRFEDFLRRLGIARNILTQRLMWLVEHGILDRVQYLERPPRYEYLLTAKGRDLWPVLMAMRQWGDRWEAPDGPPVEVLHRECGHVTQGVYVCSECAEVLRPSQMQVRPGPGASRPGRPALPVES